MIIYYFYACTLILQIIIILMTDETQRKVFTRIKIISFHFKKQNHACMATKGKLKEETLRFESILLSK